MKYDQETANETKLKVAEEIDDSLVTTDQQLSVPEIQPESLEEKNSSQSTEKTRESTAISESDPNEPFEETAVTGTKELFSSLEQSSPEEKSDSEIKQMPLIKLAASVPLFFSISLITTNLFFYMRHLNSPYPQPIAIDAMLIMLFIFSYYFFGLFFIQRIAAESGKLFKARPIDFKQSDPIKKYCKQLGAANRKDNRPKLFLVATSPIRHGYLGTGYWLFRGTAFTFLYCMFGIPLMLAFGKAFIIGTTFPNAINVILGLIMSYATIMAARRIKSRYQILQSAYNFAANDSTLKDFVNLPPSKSSKRDEITIDFDAFADIERWIKHRFSQKSRVKTIFMCCLVVLFFAFNGFSFLEQGLIAITQFLQVSGALTSGSGGTAGITSATINYFNLLLCFLGLGGMSAALYAMLQPTHLRLSTSGVSFLYNRRPFGKVRFTPWSKIKNLRIVSRKGTTMLGEKQLEFRGDKNALIKFKLNCVDSIASRENILKSIESWAPNVKRDADVIQTLQRPAEQSYTDLWLQALVAPPKRDRLKPLIVNSSLQDGRYSVIKTIGLGGQGTAYLAKDTKTAQLIVLKEFILPIYVDINVRKAALERFENEARILKGLDCAQIVKLIDFFVEDHRGYLALEYVEGEDLKTKVERTGKLTEKEVLSYAVQMCEILNYLHKQEPAVIHRDFTPDNLILQKDGSLKLIDFNVAQQTNDTITGTIVGKQCYLPPEQFQGEPIIQSDIYSMGATLFFLATGSPPSPISQSHPKEFNNELSKDFDYFVARATTIDTVLRYTSATECLEELKRILTVEDKD